MHFEFKKSSHFFYPFSQGHEEYSEEKEWTINYIG